MNHSSPILFLVFNRPAQTRATLQRIREAQPKRLYIRSEGARNHVAGESEKVAEVRAIIKNIDWPCEVKYLLSLENQGLRKGCLSALEWFFEQEPEGIIMEDDCLPDPSFFTFCDEMLARYRDDERVMHIGCSNLAEDFTKDGAASYVFTHFSFVWGWATWRRAWLKNSPNLEGLEDFLAKKDFEEMLPSRLARIYMADKFWKIKNGEMQSWAYAWFYSILNDKGLCIVPKVNLTQNTGIGDAGATNTRGRNDRAARKAGKLGSPFIAPVSDKPDSKMELRFFYTSQKARFRLWLWWLKRILVH